MNNLQEGFLVYYKDRFGEQKHRFFSDVGNALERSESNHGNYITEVGNRSPEEIRQGNKAKTLLSKK